jgi:hypothetical protein
VSNLSFSFAQITDLSVIMNFIGQHWRKNHVLSWNRELFLKDFQDQKLLDRLNIGLVKDSECELLGIFGFIFYNQSELPDLAGSLWKVTDDAQKQYPMLGIQLRHFVIKNIPHRFFAAPGAGLQTQTVYKVIRMNWHRMQHFFRINPSLPDYHLIQFSDANEQSISRSPVEVELIKVHKETAEEQLATFDFDAFPEIVPHKDKAYILRRYFDYPFYEYDVYLVRRKVTISFADLRKKIQPENIVVCRRAFAAVDGEGRFASAYRIVDFLGMDILMPSILEVLAQKMVETGDEYLDFICHGFNEDLIKQGGLHPLAFDSEDCVIPNFFEPLLRENVPVYCVSDKTALHFRQCKADGDQDRPNGIKLA